MLTDELGNKVDRIWDTFWSGGIISSPMTRLQQLTYLLFIKQLDKLHNQHEPMAAMLKKPIENLIFTKGQDNLRWSRYDVFPFMKKLNRCLEKSWRSAYE
ncbi:type I restriction-modification system subunit M N-terminal domain-containing protein [Candidatus Riflebacteria bacterium]